jgi:RND superfamily putative drug exporter
VKGSLTMPARPGIRPPLQRWGGFVARCRIPMLAAWALLAVAAGIFYPGVDSRLATPDYSVQGSESARAQTLLAERFPALGAEQGVVVFYSARLTAQAPAFRQAVQRVLASVPPGAGRLTGPYSAPGQISANGHVAVATLAMRGSPSARARLAAELQRGIQRAAAGGPVQAYLTGPSALTNDLSSVELRDQNVAESIGVPIALLVLLLAFGAVVATVLPVVTALASVLVCTALLGLLAGSLHLDRFVTVVATVFGIGIGIDYALFVISRFREELARATDRPRDAGEAVGVALRTSGRSVMTSGLIVMVALGSLALIRGHIFTEIALASGLMVACCLVASLTLLPALLSLLGDRVNWGSLPRRLRPADAGPAGAGGGRWAQWACFVLRHPYRLGVPAVLLLVGLAVPVPSIKLGIDWGLASLTDTPSGRGEQILAAAFNPGAVGPVQVIACGRDAAAAAGTQRLMGAVRSDRQVARVLPADRSGGCIALPIVLAEPVDSPAASTFVRDLRSRLAPAAFARTGATVLVGGLTAGYVDLSNETTGKLPVVVLVILAVSFCYLFIVFRSVLVPAKAVVLNLLATAAALGMTTLVFQHGYGEQLFHFTSSGTLQAYLPVALFALLFGLSMDYEVFLVGRMQEEWQRTHDDAVAIPVALSHTARQITAAAAIMVIVFGSLLFAQVLELKQFGFGLAFAVLLDATVVRLLLVPAVMGVAGRANWWLPSWLARLLPAGRIE